MGSIWLLRARAAGAPDAVVTRLLGVAADQIGQAAEQERSEAEARDVVQPSQARRRPGDLTSEPVGS